jgi:hypothetical protein
MFGLLVMLSLAQIAPDSPPPPSKRMPELPAKMIPQPVPPKASPQASPQGSPQGFVRAIPRVMQCQQEYGYEFGGQFAGVREFSLGPDRAYVASLPPYSIQPRFIVRQPAPIIRELPPLIGPLQSQFGYQPRYSGRDALGEYSVEFPSRTEVNILCPSCIDVAGGGAILEGYSGGAFAGGYIGGYGDGLVVPAWFDGHRGGRMVDKHVVKYRRGRGPFAGF